MFQFLYVFLDAVFGWGESPHWAPKHWRGCRVFGLDARWGQMLRFFLTSKLFKWWIWSSNKEYRNNADIIWNVIYNSVISLKYPVTPSSLSRCWPNKRRSVYSRLDYHCHHSERNECRSFLNWACRVLMERCLMSRWGMFAKMPPKVRGTSESQGLNWWIICTVTIHQLIPIIYVYIYIHMYDSTHLFPMRNNYRREVRMVQEVGSPDSLRKKLHNLHDPPSPPICRLYIYQYIFVST